MIGRINVYTCSRCKGETVTVDIVDGVTPFILNCRATAGCHGEATSSMYRPRAGHAPPAWEWYRPSDTVAEAAGPGMRKHAKLGGLSLRPREVKP